MKHEIHRLQSVFTADGRYAGALLRTAKGLATHDADGRLVGMYDRPDAAVAKLRRLASEGST
jgi:hypothetical protein